jgi:hypothetical protein
MERPPGLYHVASLHPEAEPWVTLTKKPVSGEDRKLENGTFFNAVWSTLAESLGRRCTRWRSPRWTGPHRKKPWRCSACGSKRIVTKPDWTERLRIT